MIENTASHEAENYLKINKVSKTLVILLNIAILVSYYQDYTTAFETAGLFFIAMILTACMLKMALGKMKKNAIKCQFIPQDGSIFDIMDRFSREIKGTSEHRIAYRKNNKLLSAHLDVTASSLILFIITTIFWLCVICPVIFSKIFH